MPDVTAALITGAQTLEFRMFEQLPPSPGCVTVDISLCGICGTEIASYRSGHLHSPAVCGHEWVGQISAVGHGVKGLSEGDRVVAGISAACGSCPECLRGLGDYCSTASLVARGRNDAAPPHGGFARSITVEQGRVVPALAGLSDEQAAQVEPATVALHGVRRSRITPGDVVVVQGTGPIGLFALQFARAAGAGYVIAIEPSESRRLLATELGATNAVSPEDANEAVAEATHGVGADIVIECAGVPQLLQTAADLTRAGGTVSLLSFLAQPATISAGRWLAKELHLTASNAFTRDDFARSMAFLADGRVKADPLHSRTVPLDKLEAALQELAAGQSSDIKVLVDPSFA